MLAKFLQGHRSVSIVSSPKRIFDQPVRSEAVGNRHASAREVHDDISITDVKLTLSWLHPPLSIGAGGALSARPNRLQHSNRFGALEQPAPLSNECATRVIFQTDKLSAQLSLCGQFELSCRNIVPHAREAATRMAKSGKTGSANGEETHFGNHDPRTSNKKNRDLVSCVACLILLWFVATFSIV